MALRASTYLSATHFIDYADGLTLKSRTLKRWLKQKGITQSKIAKILGMNKQTFRTKLYKRRKFNREEITALVYFMGAKAATRMIWFPTIEEKRRVEKYVKEGQMNNTYATNLPCHLETPTENKWRRIEEQEREYGEDWEQSEEFEKYIFDSDELPSRRLMRRRNNGQW